MNKENQIVVGIGIALGIAAIGFIVYRFKNRKSNQVNLHVFDSPDIKGSGNCMDKDLIKKLIKLAEITKLPIFEMINSGARSAYWNTKVGGVKNSAHKIPTCKAVDIKAPTKRIREMIVFAAKKIGFRRMGIGNTFVHLDVDDSKKQYVAWGYPSGNRPPINPFV